MGSLSTTFGASGSGGTPEQRVITVSGTFVTPKQAKYRITLIGAGCGAANASQAGSSGAICQSLVTLAAGVTLTISLGTRGLAGATPTPGGTSTIAATGLTTMTCTAGTPSAPGTASGGTEFNRSGVAGAVGSGKGGSSVAVYGTGYAATSQGGAGVGESAGLTAGGGSAIHGLTNVSAFLNGRVLQPAGIGGKALNGGGDECIGRPGGGGGYDSTNGSGYAGGLFAGGGGASNYYGGQGGELGGGGGSCTGGTYTGGNGGCAGAIIEWVEA